MMPRRCRIRWKSSVSTEFPGASPPWAAGVSAAELPGASRPCAAGVSAASAADPATRRRPRRASNLTSLKVAVADGVLPKAPKNGYTLFCSEVGVADVPAAGRPAAWSRLWHRLTCAERASYAARAAERIAARAEAAASRGIRIRKTKRKGAPDNTDPQAKRRAAGSGSVPAQGTMMMSVMGPFKMIAPDGVRPVIGQGSFGAVLQSIHPHTGRKVAAKFYTTEDDLTREETVYRKIAAGGGPQLDCFATFLHSELLPMPWMSLTLGPPSLAHHLKGRATPMQLEGVKALAAQLAMSLSHLHRVGYLHLDVKPGNVLWRDDTDSMWLLDFTISEPWPVPPDHPLYEQYCTWPYRPPELSLPRQPQPRTVLGPCTDVWSLGCVLYEAMTGSPLLRDKQHDLKLWWEADARNRASTAVQRRLERLPHQWRSLILSCCARNPRQRPSLQTVMTNGMGWVEARVPVLRES